LSKEYYRLLASFNFGESMTEESKSESISGKQTVSFQSVDAIEISLFIEKEGLGFMRRPQKMFLTPE
jgi:hypothetical protein